MNEFLKTLNATDALICAMAVIVLSILCSAGLGACALTQQHELEMATLEFRESDIVKDLVGEKIDCLVELIEAEAELEQFRYECSKAAGYLTEMLEAEEP